MIEWQAGEQPIAESVSVIAIDPALLDPVAMLKLNPAYRLIQGQLLIDSVFGAEWRANPLVWLMAADVSATRRAT